MSIDIGASLSGLIDTMDGVMEEHFCVPLRKCPFCGAKGKRSKNNPKLVGCFTPGCPINGILMTKERWETREPS